MVKNEHSPGFRPGSILRKTSELTYEVRSQDRVLRKHADQLKAKMTNAKEHGDLIIQDQIDLEKGPQSETLDTDAVIIDEPETSVEYREKMDSPHLRRSTRATKVPSRQYDEITKAQGIDVIKGGEAM
ncbi:hypothetical protein RF11_06433 [Thelohanellus kitauei]|uniref:Uncharacterized protein n=1 Tax=Thelohanellus kitauei TaxID=669202 RepID=A0A0C2MZ55_THEKT|nr:hypothetical protein RF11_07467 [Thelohanellus kitauei]KII72601.1 hypothetical protein RF11_06433 [Thelohanellus kitauei]